MISVFHKNQKLIVIISGVIILLFIFSSIGYMGASSISAVSKSDAVAMVGKEKIKRSLFDSLYNNQSKRLAQMGMDLDDAQVKTFLEGQTVNSMVRETALHQEAMKAGFGVSDYEIGYIVQSMFNVGGIFNKQAYIAYTKENFRMMPDEFEDIMRYSQISGAYSRVVPTPFKLTPDEIAFSYQTQNGNMKDFEKNKTLFTPTLEESKTATAQKMFFDNFNKTTEVKVYALD